VLMPRTDPPPSQKPGHAASGSGGRPSQVPRPSRIPLQMDEAAAQREREKDVLDDLEITVSESEISLSDAEQLAEGSLTSGWPEPELEPSEHERVTVAPPMPEHEYVARMMKELPEAERIPPSRAITPARGLSKPPLGPESTPTKAPAIAPSTAPPRKTRRPSARPKAKDSKPGTTAKPRARTSRSPPAAPALAAARRPGVRPRRWSTSWSLSTPL